MSRIFNFFTDDSRTRVPRTPLDTPELHEPLFAIGKCRWIDWHDEHAVKFTVDLAGARYVIKVSERADDVMQYEMWFHPRDASGRVIWSKNVPIMYKFVTKRNIGVVSPAFDFGDTVFEAREDERRLVFDPNRHGIFELEMRFALDILDLLAAPAGRKGLLESPFDKDTAPGLQTRILVMEGYGKEIRRVMCQYTSFMYAAFSPSGRVATPPLSGEPLCASSAGIEGEGGAQ